MNQWEKAFAEHRVHALLADASSVAEAIELPSAEPPLAENYRRVLLILKHVKRLLGLADPNLVVSPILDQIAAPLQNLKSSLDNYKANPSPTFLAQANTQGDQILQKLTAIPLLSLPRSAGALKETMESFSKTSGELLLSLKASADEMKSKLGEITDELTQHRLAIEKHDATIDAQKARVDSVVSEFQSQFSTAEDKRRNEHATQLTQAEEDYATFKKQIEEGQEAFFEEQKQEQQNRLTDLESNAASTIAKLNDLQKQASDIVQVISNIGVTGNYSKYASADRKTANMLRFLAVLFMIGLIAGAISTIWVAIKTGQVDWHIIGFRVYVTLTFAIPAFYLAYESEKHRATERRYRIKELELASIDPYLERLPEETRRDIKARLTERFFGATSSEVTGKDETVSAKSVWDFLKDIIEMTLKK